MAMTGSMYGADADALEAFAGEVTGAAHRLHGSRARLTREIHASPWSGRSADRFRSVWDSEYQRTMAAASTFLGDAAETLERNADEQREASGAAGGAAPLTAEEQAWLKDILEDIFGPGGSAEDEGMGWRDLLDTIWDIYKVGKFGLQTLPMLLSIISSGDVAFALYKGALAGDIPFTHAGLLQGLAKVANKLPYLSRFDLANRALAFVSSPGGQAFLTKAGIVAGVVGTGIGVYKIIKEGNPVDAFKRDPGAYLSLTTGTAFTALSTVALVAGGPVTLGLAAGAGVIWAGAEIYNHWDDISEAGGKAWDWAGDRASDAKDWAGDRVDDVKDGIGDAVDGVKNLAKDPVGTIGSWL